jgi:UDPglucose--hexose-1-phosphate uridylyltransferase
MKESSHRRLNLLTNEWVLISPHRMLRPWQGKIEKLSIVPGSKHDPGCYLCPGNQRANGEFNPAYTSTFAFNNDFSAFKYLCRGEKELEEQEEQYAVPYNELLVAKPETGICRVICFSPRHDVTLAELGITDIIQVIKAWKKEFEILGKEDYINYIEIFENKGELMGCSNSHPHGQIWAEETIPVEPLKEQNNQLNYYNKHQSMLLLDYLNIELVKRERLVYENNSFVLLVPFWAAWPFETIIIPKRSIQDITQFTEGEIEQFADILKVITVKYDNIFNISFPYSAGIHQAPTDGGEHKEWQLHMHFYPPLLRSASIKKFMVGYEMFANPQRDITPEKIAEILINVPNEHYNLG